MIRGKSRWWLALLGGVLAGSAAPAAADGGRAAVGAWELAWRSSRVEGYQNRFRETVGNDTEFPIRWDRSPRFDGDYLVFHGPDGAVAEQIPLGPDERVVAAENGSAFLVWSPDTLSADDRRFRYFRRGGGEPEWEASAPGDPVLFAPDGGVFVIAVRNLKRDRFARIVNDTGGELQVVGAAGEVRGELPVYPVFAEVAGDGRHLLFLHNEQLIALGRDGRLAWERAVPLDALVYRDGVPQLAVGGDRVVVCGTGVGPGRLTTTLHPRRRGYLAAFDAEGRLQWEHFQPGEEELWFQISAAVAPDGSTVATCHASANTLVVRAWDGGGGDLLWEQRMPRRDGFRALSVADGGRRILLAQCDNTTLATVWNRTGDVVWDGSLPLPTRAARLAAGDLLVGDTWIVHLAMEEPES